MKKPALNFGLAPQARFALPKHRQPKSTLQIVVALPWYARLLRCLLG